MKIGKQLLKYKIKNVREFNSLTFSNFYNNSPQEILGTLSSIPFINNFNLRFKCSSSSSSSVLYWSYDNVLPLTEHPDFCFSEFSIGNEGGYNES